MEAATLVAGPAFARRPRAFVRLSGRDAESFLQRMVSNDVAALAPGASCEALLLTAKARVIAPLRVVRRASDDFLLLTELELGDRVRAELVRSRFAAKVEIEREEHESVLLLGTEVQAPAGVLAVSNEDYGVPGLELIGESLEVPAGVELDADGLEALRIEAGTPRFGRELDDRVLPAEAGLVERAVSFSKGCYPGQEPIARLHYRGHANRGLRVLVLEGAEPPEYDAEVRHEGKPVGRLTSAARARDGRLVGLAYVRVAVPPEAELEVGPTKGRPLHSASPRP